MNVIRRFFSVEGMLGKTDIKEKPPSTKEVYKNNIMLAWPAALQGIGLSLAMLADTAMVGTLGKEAIAAVGISHLPIYMVTAVIRSLNIGITAVISRRYGENDKNGISDCFKHGLIINTVISLLLLVVVIKFSRQIVVFAGAGNDIIDLAESYYRIVCFGNFFNCLCLTINAAQIGLGNTKISMITNIMANVVNLIMNYFLIYGKGPFPCLGVKGAGIATAIGYISAFVLSIRSVSFKNRDLCIFNWYGWKFKKYVTISIFKVGLPALVENCLMQCGFLIHQRLVAGLGTAAIAAHQIGNSIYNISFYFGDGLATAAAAMVGRQLGAGKAYLARIYGKASQRTALIAACAVCLFMCITRNYLPQFFTSDTDVLTLLPPVVVVIGILTILQTTGLVYAGALRGAGDTKYVAVSSLICITIVRPVIAYLFMYTLGLGFFGGWLGYIVDQILRVAFGLVRFNGDKWIKIKV